MRATDRQGTLAGALLALVAAGIGLATSFGVHITAQEHDAILTFCGAVAVAAPLVGASFDHAKHQAAAISDITAAAAAAQAAAVPPEVAAIDAQIEELQRRKEALAK